MIENILPEIRQIRTEDIPHLIECVRRCYGDSYPSAMMYDPVLLQEALDNKLMYSVVAIGPNGRVIGHCALTFEGPHDHSPEVGKMIVDPDFRGHHIADAMAKERIAIAKELGLSGFWGACVTNHPYSQEEMISLGAVETGTLLGVSEPNTVMEGLQNFSDSRRSVIITYLPLKEHAQTIFVPSHHQSLVSTLSERLKLTRSITESKAQGTGKTEFTTAVHTTSKMASMRIFHIGEDFTEMIKSKLHELDQLNLAVIYLSLPITQEAVINAWLHLENQGFFWGAWMPNFSNMGDIIRLQKLNQAINAAEIICARKEGEYMKQYSLNEWERVKRLQSNSI